MMGMAMVPAAFFNLFAMRQQAVVGCLLGIGLPFLAARIMKRARRGDAKRAAVLMGVAAFFTSVLSFITSPFAKVSPVPADGRGLNPLLQIGEQIVDVLDAADFITTGLYEFCLKISF